MRMLAKALTTLAVTAAAVAVTAAPAQANHQCMASDLACVVTPGTVIPIGTPVIPVTGSTSYRVPLFALCLPTCSTVYLVVPGAVVSSYGATIAQITVPEYGVRVDSNLFPSVYGGVPVVTPGVPSGLGVSLFVQVPWLPVQTDDMACVESVPVGAGPATAWLSGDCLVNVLVRL